MPAPASHTIKQFCALENLSRSKVYEEIAAGRIAVVKIGTRSLIYEEERQRYRAELLAEARRLADSKRLKSDVPERHEHRVAISTENEPHGGAFAGTHASYRLGSKVDVRRGTKTPWSAGRRRAPEHHHQEPAGAAP